MRSSYQAAPSFIREVCFMDSEDQTMKHVLTDLLLCPLVALQAAEGPRCIG